MRVFGHVREGGYPMRMTIAGLVLAVLLGLGLVTSTAFGTFGRPVQVAGDNTPGLN